MYSLVECSPSLDVSDIELLDGAVEFNHVLTDFLLMNLPISDGGNQVSDYNSGFIYFFL